jgi:NTP pyrophosphatase (non-canonical NTP hydrolase)
MQECVKGVYEFNSLAGNFDNITYEKLIAQAKFNLEEAQELYDALVNKEGVAHILKEAGDNGVTLVGFFGMLERLGFDVKGAWNAVNENNMSKFTKCFVDAKYSQHFYEETTPVKIEYNEQHDVWILRDNNGKIRKPLSYRPVDVSKFCPKGVV